MKLERKQRIESERVPIRLAPAVLTRQDDISLPQTETDVSNPALTPPETETGPVGTPGIIIPGSMGGIIVGIWGQKRSPGV